MWREAAAEPTFPAVHSTCIIGPGGLYYLLPSTNVSLRPFALRTRVNAGPQRPAKMPVKRILRKLSRLRKSDAKRIKAIFSPPRQNPRALLATDVRVKGDDFTFTARSVQLGPKGMSLSQAGQLSLAQPVLLTFALPSGHPVRIGAVVWWKTADLVGLRFDPRENNRHIEEWIRSTAILSSKPI
jgi:PilZ domain